MCVGLNTVRGEEIKCTKYANWPENLKERTTLRQVIVIKAIAFV
jgi:hypothetical protein